MVTDFVYVIIGFVVRDWSWTAELTNYWGTYLILTTEDRLFLFWFCWRFAEQCLCVSGFFFFSCLHDRATVRSGAEIGLLSLRISVSQGASLGDFLLAGNSLRGDWAIFCHAGSGQVGRVWSGREKSHGWELNPGHGEDRRWAIPLSYHDWLTGWHLWNHFWIVPPTQKLVSIFVYPRMREIRFRRKILTASDTESGYAIRCTWVLSLYLYMWEQCMRNRYLLTDQFIGNEIILNKAPFHLIEFQLLPFRQFNNPILPVLYAHYSHYWGV